jgi:hypothetical protein
MKMLAEEVNDERREVHAAALAVGLCALNVSHFAGMLTMLGGCEAWVVNFLLPPHKFVARKVEDTRCRHVFQLLTVRD